MAISRCNIIHRCKDPQFILRGIVFHQSRQDMQVLCTKDLMVHRWATPSRQRWAWCLCHKRRRRCTITRCIHTRILILILHIHRCTRKIIRQFKPSSLTLEQIVAECSEHGIFAVPLFMEFCPSLLALTFQTAWTTMCVQQTRAEHSQLNYYISDFNDDRF